VAPTVFAIGVADAAFPFAALAARARRPPSCLRAPPALQRLQLGIEAGQAVQVQLLKAHIVVKVAGGGACKDAVLGAFLGAVVVVRRLASLAAFFAVASARLRGLPPLGRLELDVEGLEQGLRRAPLRGLVLLPRGLRLLLRRRLAPPPPHVAASRCRRRALGLAICAGLRPAALGGAAACCCPRRRPLARCGTPLRGLQTMASSVGWCRRRCVDRGA
jgi:hypothetical protein